MTAGQGGMVEQDGGQHQAKAGQGGATGCQAGARCHAHLIAGQPEVVEGGCC